jgi:acyl carrier protein
VERSELEKTVREVLIKHLGVEMSEVVRPDAKLVDDLGADSLDAIELIIELEDRLTIEIDDRDADKLQTVGELIDYLSNRVNKVGEGTRG